MNDLAPVPAESIWTQFWDMNSGGGTKEEFKMCYIEAPEDEAVSVFYSRFGHNPRRVTCTCCGEDYSISEGRLAELTAYHRDLRSVEKGDWHVDRDGYEQRYLEPDESVPDGWKLSDLGGYRYRQVMEKLDTDLKQAVAQLEAKVNHPGTSEEQRAICREGVDKILRGRGAYGIDLQTYLNQTDVFAIRAHEIQDHERIVEPPEQGYVWVE